MTKKLCNDHYKAEVFNQSSGPMYIPPLFSFNLFWVMDSFKNLVKAMGLFLTKMQTTPPPPFSLGGAHGVPAPPRAALASCGALFLS